MGTAELLQEYNSNSDYTVPDLKQYRYLMFMMHLTSADIYFNPIIIPVNLFRASTVMTWQIRSFWNQGSDAHIAAAKYISDTSVRLTISGTSTNEKAMLYGIR